MYNYLKVGIIPRLIKNTFTRLKKFILKKSFLANYLDKDIIRIIEIINNIFEKYFGFRTSKKFLEIKKEFLINGYFFKTIFSAVNLCFSNLSLFIILS